MTPLYPSLEDSFALDFYLPDSPLIGAPAVVAYADSRLAERMASATPPQVVFVDFDGDVASLHAVLRTIAGRAYPIVRFTTPALGDAVADFALSNNLGDLTLCVPYDLRSILPPIRERLPLSRGMLDLRGVTLPENHLDLACDAQESDATMVLVDTVPTRKHIRDLQKRFLQVFVDGHDTDALLSGACGIITADPCGLYGLIADLPERSTVRPTPLFAHKALHKNGVLPENSVAAAIAAGREGYDACEVDALLTRDGEAVLLHNQTTGTLFDKNLKIDETDWSELSQLRRKAHPEHGLDRVETLYTEMAKYPDTPILFENKALAANGGVEAMATYLEKLFERPDVQRNGIGLLAGSWTTDHMAYFHRHLSRMAFAYCTGVKEPVTYTVAEANAKLCYLAGRTVGGNAAWNPSWQEVTPLLARLAHLRGITVFTWSWAFEPWESEREPLTAAFASGYDGLTSDWVEPFADCPTDITAKGRGRALLHLRTGETVEVDAAEIALPDGRYCVGYAHTLPDGRTLTLLSEAFSD